MRHERHRRHVPRFHGLCVMLISLNSKVFWASQHTAQFLSARSISSARPAKATQEPTRPLRFLTWGSRRGAGELSHDYGAFRGTVAHERPLLAADEARLIFGSRI